MLKKHETTNWLLFPTFNVKVLKQKRQNIVRSVGLGSLRSKTRTKVPRSQWQIPSLWCWRPPPKRNPGCISSFWAPLQYFILCADVTHIWKHQHTSTEKIQSKYQLVVSCHPLPHQMSIAPDQTSLRARANSLRLTKSKPQTTESVDFVWSPP